MSVRGLVGYFGGKFVDHFVKAAVAAAVTAAGVYLKRTYPHVPPWAFWIGGTLSAVALLFYFGRQGLQRVLYRWHVAELSGISRIYPVQPFGSTDTSTAQPAERDLAEAGVRELIGNSEGEVLLLLASGWRYIGCMKHRGMLYEQLDGARPPQIFKVLIISEAAAARRAAVEGMDPTRYIEGINAVLYTLAQWKAVHGLDIQVRRYEEDPIWQMVIDAREMWLLCAKNTKSDSSPIYCLRREADYGLHWGLMAVWERRWSIGTPVDFNTISPPNWNLLQHVAAIGS